LAFFNTIKPLPGVHSQGVSARWMAKEFQHHKGIKPTAGTTTESEFHCFLIFAEQLELCAFM
jgi:hypothetical protein